MNCISHAKGFFLYFTWPLIVTLLRVHLGNFLFVCFSRHLFLSVSWLWQWLKDCLGFYLTKESKKWTDLSVYGCLAQNNKQAGTYTDNCSHWSRNRAMATQWKTVVRSWFTEPLPDTEKIHPVDFPYKPRKSPDKVADKLRTKFGQPPFQDLAPGCKQPSSDNKNRTGESDGEWWPLALYFRICFEFNTHQEFLIEGLLRRWETWILSGEDQDNINITRSNHFHRSLTTTSFINMVMGQVCKKN